MSILIAEDNPISLKLLEINLRKSGYDTISAETGKEAYVLMQKHLDVQLLITDIMMPDMDGFELIDKINEHPELKGIPVIICTALNDIESVRKIAKRGIKHYVSKPVNVKLLIQKIYEILKIEEPILRDKKQIMAQYYLDQAAYDEVAKSLSGLVRDKKPYIEKLLAGDKRSSVLAQANELIEGASLLGAERLKSVLDRIIAEGHSADETEELTHILFREMKVLESVLPPPGPPETAPNQHGSVGSENAGEGQLQEDSDYKIRSYTV